nr:hypothetical protein [Plesiomonas shigelloides]
MENLYEHYNSTQNAPDNYFEALWQQCQNRIGRGSGRDVYEIPSENNDKVLKVSSRHSNFSNWAEIIIYNNAFDQSYFAEIFSWSLSGKFLVMERLSPVTPAQLSGHMTPMSITDKKAENFGIDKSGNIKLLDYALFTFDVKPLFKMP